MLYVDKAGESPLLGDLSRIRACLQSGHQQINYDAAGRYPAAKPVLSSLIDGLVDEQRGLCVYCTRRIAGHMTERLPLSRILGPDDMDRPVDAHVEHYVPRHPGPWYTGKGRTSADALSLDYRNLFAVCNGQGGTCDKSRGNQRLRVDPRDPSDIRTISYTVGGYSAGQAGRARFSAVCIQSEVDKGRKRNVERLRAWRAGVQQMLYNMLEGLSDEETEEFCEDILRSLESDGRPPSFAPMLVQMLEDEIAALRGLPEAAVPAPDA